MITELDLLKLRYKVVTRLEDTDNTIEFIHQDLSERSYLVKLRNGEIRTVYPDDKRRLSCKTSSLNVLVDWHQQYVQEFNLQ